MSIPVTTGDSYTVPAAIGAVREAARVMEIPLAEATALALDGRVESHTLGKQITVEQVEEIACLASKHGLKLGGFRSFERAVTPDQIERVKAASAKTRARRAREVIA